MSKSYRSDFESRSPSRFLSPQEEYERGLRRRPKTLREFEDDDDEDLVDTDQQVVDDEEE